MIGRLASALSGKAHAGSVLQEISSSLAAAASSAAPAAAQQLGAAWRPHAGGAMARWRQAANKAKPGSFSTAPPPPPGGAGATGAAAEGGGASSSASSSPRSILDANSHGMGAHASVLEGAAEQRMQRIKAAAEAQGELPPAGPAKIGVVRQALRLIGRTVMVAGTAAGIAAGYYTWAYDTRDLQVMVTETKAKRGEEANFLTQQVWLPLMEKYLATRIGLEKQIKSYRDPTYDRLLPDPRPEMKAMGIKTLVLDLNDVLVSKSWTRQKGWSLLKRPGAQDFLFEMGQYYEVVIYTDEPSAYATPVINKLDKNQVVPYRLFRPETQYHEGKHVRDLSKLNRDLSQVLFISANPDAYAFQPENTLKLKPWKNDPSDTTLLDLLPMLQMIALKGVKDVRDVVKSYEGEEDIAKAFKKRMHNIQHPQQHAKPRGLLPTFRQ